MMKLNLRWVVVGGAIVATIAAILLINNKAIVGSGAPPATPKPISTADKKQLGRYITVHEVNTAIRNDPTFKKRLGALMFDYHHGHISKEDMLFQISNMIEVYKNEYTAYVLKRDS